MLQPYSKVDQINFSHQNSAALLQSGFYARVARQKPLLSGQPVENFVSHDLRVFRVFSGQNLTLWFEYQAACLEETR